MLKSFLNFQAENIAGTLDAEDPSSGPEATFVGMCRIGAFSYVGRGTVVARTNIGRFCSIGQDAYFGLFNHRISGLSSHPFVYGGNAVFRGVDALSRIRGEPIPPEQKTRIYVGNDVWIGKSALFRTGITVGHGAVVAAGAVVVKDVLPYEIVGGVAAKRIRMRFPEEVIDRLLALKWWDYDLSHPAVVALDKADILQCLDPLEKLVAAGELRKARFKKVRVESRPAVNVS